MSSDLENAGANQKCCSLEPHCELSGGAIRNASNSAGSHSFLIGVACMTLYQLSHLHMNVLNTNCYLQTGNGTVALSCGRLTSPYLWQLLDCLDLFKPEHWPPPTTRK